MILRITAFVLIALALVGGLLYSQYRPDQRKVSGFIEADEIRLGSRVGGRVQAVHIEEGQHVEKGELLVELEPYDLLQRKAEAEAIRDQRKTAYERLVAGYREEEIAQAQSRYDQAVAHRDMLQNGPRPQELEAGRADLNLALAEQALADELHSRALELLEQGAGSQEEVDLTTNRLNTANERVAARKEQLDLLEEGTRVEEIAVAEAQVREAEQAWQMLENGYRQQEVEEAYHAMKAAESSVQAIDEQIQELQVTAPVEGDVEAIELQPGDLVSANAPVVAIVDSRRLWVRAYVPEDQLDLALGDRVTITVDSYPGERFTGEVTFISRQAEFTPSNVQTPEERSQQVFRIKVTLIDGLDRLRPGMAGDVWLDGEP